jgi:ribosome maturation factor RimP
MSSKGKTPSKSNEITRNRDVLALNAPQTPELLADLKRRVVTHLEIALDGTEHFAVGIQWSGDSRKLSVKIDGDKGVNIGVCSQLNRSLGKIIDEHGWQGSVVLEVGSPGAETPLVTARQYPQHLGRRLRIVQNDGSVLTGTLCKVEDSVLSLQGQEDRELYLSFGDIKEAKVIVP